MNQFQRILNLVKKTGDRLVVTDPNGEHAYVVMDIDDYEFLVDAGNTPFFEDDLMDAVDFEEEFEAVPTVEQAPAPVQDIWDVMQSAGEQGETWDPSSLSEEELQDLEEQYQRFTERNVEEAIEEIQEPLQTEQKPEIAEEEFYLEPIE